MRILGISGTIVGSKTGIAVKQALASIQQHYPDIDTAFLDLKQYDL